MARKYRDAAAQIQENVKKHLPTIKQEVSSSEDEEPINQNVLDGVLQSYWNVGGNRLMLERTKNLLEEAISGRSITCIICFGSVKRVDAIWTCEHCYCYFHLSCVQKWANDSNILQSEDTIGPIAVFGPKKIKWCCPKCRHSYSKDDIPRKYSCFCNKTDNPVYHSWLIPHTCGEVCMKRLSLGTSCKHKCLLLCHPGPCPPCPQTANGACYCGNEFKIVKCSAALWSCQQQCKKTLPCKSHKCETKCHDGDCPPCNDTRLQLCQCGAEKTMRPCNEVTWQCTQCPKLCNNLFDCKTHKCDKICHTGNCGKCPYFIFRNCTCGANEFLIECGGEMDICYNTCESRHEDCEHDCPEYCHEGPCPPCQVLIEKKCQCSTHTQLLPCSEEFRCETKCKGTRPCGKHGCARKCCNGNCPPCEKVCDKPLQCGQHKCTTVCHRGSCYPCLCNLSL